MMNNLWHELKRRNVVKVAIAYAVVSWLVIQIGDIAADNLNFPDWFMPMIFVLVALGFPIALIISWAFELTPEGLKKTAEVDKNKSTTPKTGHRINKLIIGGLALAVVFLLVDKFYLSGPDQGQIIPETRAGQTTIAVLPFANMSGDPAQEFFSDGMTEEILNVLAKNRSLRVAGRTSSFAFKGKNEDLRTIGKDLGVDYLIEGSVRKDADTVRITAQLIQAKEGFHVWSETYDRKLTDIFVVQDEIARAVAGALEVSFGGETGKPNVANQTDNMAAYDLYLKAKDAHKNRHIPEALDYAKKVTEMEPKFAPGWAVYAQALALAPNWIYNDEPLESAGGFARAEIAAQRALILDPKSIDALGALANVYRTRLQWKEAEETYLSALEIDPDSPVILEDYTEFLLAVGKIKQMTPLSEKLAKLEPQVAIYQNSLLNGYIVKDDFDAAVRIAKKMYDLDPDSPVFTTNYVDALMRAGQKAKAREILEGNPKMDPERKKIWRVYIKSREGRLEDLTPEEAEFAMNDPLALAFLNRKEDFFALLSREVKLGWWGDFFTFYQETRPYWNTPEFKNHIRELKLVDYWKTNGWGDFCKPKGQDDFECKYD